MRTRLIQWLDTCTRVSDSKAAIKMTVMHGVQVHCNGVWMNAARNGKALIFKSLEKAQAERKKLRAIPSTDASKHVGNHAQ